MAVVYMIIEVIKEDFGLGYLILFLISSLINIKLIRIIILLQVSKVHDAAIQAGISIFALRPSQLLNLAFKWGSTL